MKKMYCVICGYRNYSVEEIQQNELMSNKHKKVCTTLTYWTLFILASAVTGCM